MFINKIVRDRVLEIMPNVLWGSLDLYVELGGEGVFGEK